METNFTKLAKVFLEDYHKAETTLKQRGEVNV